MSTVTNPTYLSKLKSREEVAEQTMAFHFERPSGFMIQVKRVNEKPSRKDGLRTLVDRLWPRSD